MNTVLLTNQNSVLMQIFSLLSSVMGIYSLVILVRIMLTWIPRQNMYNQYGQPIQQERPVYDLLCKITDPYLKIFRSSRLTIGRIDFSTLFAFMVLNVLKSLFSTIATYGTITLGIIIGVCLQGIWSYLISYFLGIMLVIMGIRWYLGRKNGQYSGPLDNIIQKPVNFVFRTFFKNKVISEQKLVAYSFFFYLVIFLILRFVFRNLVPLLYTI